MIAHRRRRTINHSGSNSSCPRILLVEQDPDVARLIVEALDDAWEEAVQPDVGADQRPGVNDASTARAATPTGSTASPPVVVNALRELHDCYLEHFDIVICGMDLVDATGLDALAYVRGMRPDLPVIITGTASDAPVAVEAIRAGAMDFLITTSQELRALPLAVEKCLAHQRIKRDNERLQSDLSRSLSELAVKNQQLQSMIHQLETMARTDDLTGLYNRRWLNLMLERCWAEAIRNGRPLAFMMIDLDGFKLANDEVGHQRGDELLALAGKVIEANCRQVDVPARYGGDEFCVLMPGTEAQDAVRVAERIGREFDYAVKDEQQHGIPLSMSIGIAHGQLSRPANIDELIKHADDALYTAKAEGKHRVMIRRGDGAYDVAECDHF